MKALVIGLGSMGKRRVRNLKALGVREIYGFERSPAIAEEAKSLYDITLISSLTNLKDQNFGLAVISTPPESHLPFAKSCAMAGIPFFLELNLTTRESRAIESLARKHQVKALPSNTELFSSDIAELGALVRGKGGGYFVFHLGQNIHDWHPWQKTGEHFIFKPKTNGIREMLRVELPWILALFGSVKEVTARSARFETKKYGVDDYMSVELTFKNGFKGVLIFDLLTPEVIKQFEVVRKEKRVVWYERRNTIEVNYRGGESLVKNLRSQETLAQYKFPEDAHLAEMQHVLGVIRGSAKSRLTFSNERSVLELIDRIERAAHK